MPRKLVVANWKMHGNLASNKQLLEAYIQKITPINNIDVVVCVPYPYLAQAQSILQNTNIAWGAQNISKDAVGAYTGEVSAVMLKDFGARYVIIGHSERATAYCESDENIATKFAQAKAHGIIPILCVGETLIEREAGVMQMVVGKQLDTIINTYGAGVFANAVVSYEPIWAIGTGLAASSDQAQSMHEFIRGKVAVLDKSAAASLKILYGGSVNPQNAVQLFVMQDIDGGLIGKCSLNAQEFEGICRAAT
ncbi:triose-phosphate isomerase [Methylotenera sp.]|uniref:triose-phosphate isomerase n=1 Tax=Methylotenera sp. TaxID=2051956 RepID=UPI00271EA81A|nr:triose-phosphate isomerase [Methylotenera sp.]MDO9205296.1 triose-phosphate isomerase [Methylotenera sp.]MDO9393831.1 triose-phosphate isomerase [Methylotenera sp.]MDP1523998.1 triose-phosphate isomerase [Methylotenera sp.]MDP2072307.1 triose-phosphate isomerase [Methylotenera sp.]MDP3005106.1 triose-phosphate isomerase [Methylotenera sp.]